MDYRRGSKKRLYPSAKRKKRTGQHLAEWREKLKGNGRCLEVTPKEEPAETPCVSSDNQTSNDIALIGRRIIDVGYFFNRLRQIDNHSPSNCSLANMTVVSEISDGLRTGIELKCSMCFIAEIVWSENPDSHKMHVNTAAVSGIRAMGGEHSNLEHILSALDIPSMTLFTFQKEHERISSASEETASKEMNDSAVEEKLLLTVVADGCQATSYMTNYSSLYGATSGTAAKEVEKKDHLPIEPTVEIKEEPTDYASNPSTSSNNTNEEFILPHEENSWATSDSVVEPRFTLSVANLSSPNGPETSDGEQPKKKRKPNPNRITSTSTFVPPVKNGPRRTSESPVYNFDEFPMPSSFSNESRGEFPMPSFSKEPRGEYPPTPNSFSKEPRGEYPTPNSFSKEPRGEFSTPGSASKESRKDQFDVFGEYIAAKLRSLDRRSCAFAQKAIGDIIFDAEMGKYLTEGHNRHTITHLEAL